MPTLIAGDISSTKFLLKGTQIPRRYRNMRWVGQGSWVIACSILAMSAAPLLTSTGRAVAASNLFITCPVGQVETKVVDRLTPPWRATPQRGRVLNVEVDKIGGRIVLICNYRAFGGTMPVLRYAPSGARSCAPKATAFICSVPDRAR